MNLARLPPCDVELEAIQRDDRSYRITLRLRTPLHAGWPAKLVADPYNYPRLVELAHKVYVTLNRLVRETQFTPAQLNDTELGENFDPLNNLLYRMRCRGVTFNLIPTEIYSIAQLFQLRSAPRSRWPLCWLAN